MTGVRRGLESIRLADQLYWLAHHAIDQSSRLQPRTQGLMLAGGLIGELMVDGHVVLERGCLAAVSGAPPAVEKRSDRIMLDLYDQIHWHPDVSIALWIKVFQSRAQAFVVERLQQDELLVRASSPNSTSLFRRFWPAAGRGSGPACTRKGEPVASKPWGLLSLRLSRRDAMTVDEVFVVALALTAGLRDTLLAGNASSEDYAGALTRGLPADLGTIVSEVAAAVGNAVLTPGR